MAKPMSKEPRGRTARTRVGRPAPTKSAIAGKGGVKSRPGSSGKR